MKPSSNLFLSTFTPFFLVILIAFQAQAQEKCGTVLYNKNLRGASYEKANAQFENWIQAKTLKRKASNLRAKETIYTIPVVVHVIHNGEELGEGSNIPDEQIVDQIRILNEDYRRNNADTVNTPNEFKPVAADIGFEFVLAKQDPEGLPTDGIVRVQGAKTSWSLGTGSVDDEGTLKGESYWPAEDYLNVWVTTLSADLIGYAQFPESDLEGLDQSSQNRLRDGVVIDFAYFGSNGNADNSSLGRTATHEIGHFFGLRHTWGDASSSASPSNCEVDDFCEDTPNTNGPTTSSGICPVNKTTCGSRDMIQNYMDYTGDVCMNIFTQDQKERMLTVIENSPRRTSLLTSPGLEEAIVAGKDIGIREITSPQKNACSGEITPSVLLVNTGEDDLNSYTVALYLQGNQISQATGNKLLSTGDSTVLTFPAVVLNEESETYDLSFEVQSVNGEEDINTANNLQSIDLYIPKIAEIPFLDDFQDSTSSILFANGFIDNPDGNTTWAIADAPGNGSNNQALYIDFFDYETGIGENDILYSPTLDFSEASDITLRFKVAYAPFPDAGEDRFLVGISTDCGNTIQTFVYNKGGKSLATTDELNNEFVPSSRSDWREEEISLNEFIGQPNVQLAFVAQNGYGNNLYIDDVEIDAVVKADIDLKLKAISSPSYLSCETEPTPEIVIVNQGVSLVTTFDINYSVDGGAENTFTYTGNPIEAGQEFTITLEQLSLTEGSHTLDVEIANPNSIADQHPADNLVSYPFIIDNQRDVIPLLQSFRGTTITDPGTTTGSDNAWSVVNPDSSVTWLLNETPIDNEENQAALLPHYLYTKIGAVDQLVTPILDFTQTNEASLFFNVSYAFYDEEYVDTLRVKVSTDCGLTYQTVYEKYGQDLSVVESTDAWVPESSQDWRQEYVDLTEFAGMSDVRVVFESVNGYGNNLYLDDIEFFVSNNPEPIAVQTGKFVIFPVPTNDVVNVTFNLLEKETAIIQIYDTKGSVLLNRTYPNTLNQQYFYDFTNKAAGVYLMRIMSNSINSTQRFVVR